MTQSIIANWKMHFSLTEVDTICKKLAENPKNNSIIAPPAPYLAYLAAKFPSLNFCAQNLCEFSKNGPYTGEYSGVMLKSCGINYAIIGHSERRSLYNESDQTILAKVSAALNAKVTPIICIGESAETRQNGGYKEFLINQLESSLPSNIEDDIIIAYEPIWSIGTNELPTNIELMEAFEVISSNIAQSPVAKNVRLLYGGSVNLDNIEQVLSLKHVNGVLVGKSSLDPEILVKMLER